MLSFFKRKPGVSKLTQWSKSRMNINTTYSVNDWVGNFCRQLIFRDKDNKLKITCDIVWMYFWMQVMSNEGTVNDETMVNRSLSYASALGYKLLVAFNANEEII